MTQQWQVVLEGRGLPILLGGVVSAGLSVALWLAILLGGWVAL